MMIRTVIVDDEALARAGLRSHLARHDDLQLVGECEDGIVGAELIRQLDPDLILLDINMPGLDGFGLLEALAADSAPQVIFITAFDEYAVRAFRVGAVDYLLKPIIDGEFDEAIARVRSKLSVRPHDDVPHGGSPAHPPFFQRLLVRDHHRVRFVPVEEIDWIETADNYLRLHCGTSQFVIRGTMADLMSRLDPQRFARIHRRTAVNLNRIESVYLNARHDYVVSLRDGVKLKLSRMYRDRVLTHG
jgi:two-component system LytT family response regulator